MKFMNMCISVYTSVYWFTHLPTYRTVRINQLKPYFRSNLPIADRPGYVMVLPYKSIILSSKLIITYKDFSRHKIGTCYLQYIELLNS